MHHMDVNVVLNTWRLSFYVLVASLTIRTIRTTLYVQASHCWKVLLMHTYMRKIWPKECARLPWPGWRDAKFLEVV
jgi:hypothetical protein